MLREVTVVIDNPKGLDAASSAFKDEDNLRESAKYFSPDLIKWKDKQFSFCGKYLLIFTIAGTVKIGRDKIRMKVHFCALISFLEICISERLKYWMEKTLDPNFEPSIITNSQEGAD